MSQVVLAFDRIPNYALLVSYQKASSMGSQSVFSAVSGGHQSGRSGYGDRWSDLVDLFASGGLRRYGTHQPHWPSGGCALLLRRPLSLAKG